MFECPFCGKPNEFKTLEARNKHVVFVHGGEVIVKRNDKGEWIFWIPKVNRSVK